MNMRALALVGVMGFVAACDGGGEEPPPTEPTAESCATVSNAFPADQATNVYYRVTLTFQFSEADPSASITLTGPDGDVSGSGEWLGQTYVWQPDAPLAPSTSYDVTLSYCDGAREPMTSFTTGVVGAAIPDADTNLPGRTYALDVGVGSSANFIEPPGVGGILQTALDDAGIDILLGIESADGSAVQMIGAVGDGANPVGQDLCLPTIPFPVADFSGNPFFTVGPQDVTFDLLGTSFTLVDLNVDGAFAPDGSAIAGATLSGSLDTREVVGLLGQEDPAEDAVCELAGQVGVSCEPCADGTGDFCLSALVTNIQAGEVAGLELVPTTEEEAEANCPPASE